MTKTYHWCTGSGRIELELTRDQFESGSHSGACDDDIATLRRVPAIAAQLEQIEPALLSEELREYGAWDDAERADHDANLSRLLWLACGDLCDGEG